MSAGDFMAEGAKKSVREAVQKVEATTSAEVVVAVRRSSGHYRHTDYLLGAVLAFAGLTLFLYHPEPFDWTYLPLELAGFFAVGALASAFVAPIRRMLTLRALLDESVVRSARAAFVELGVGRTKARTGILVFVSLFEARVSVVADVGVDETLLGQAWTDAKKKLDRAVRLDGDVERFVEALLAVGPVLAEHLPRAADDVNELSDEMDDDDDDDGEEDEEDDDEEGAAEDGEEEEAEAPEADEPPKRKEEKREKKEKKEKRKEAPKGKKQAKEDDE